MVILTQSTEYQPTQLMCPESETDAESTGGGPGSRRAIGKNFGFFVSQFVGKERQGRRRWQVVDLNLDRLLRSYLKTYSKTQMGFIRACHGLNKHGVGVL